MKLLKIIALTLSLFSLGTISALSVQDLIDSGECPAIKEVLNIIELDLSKKGLINLEGLQNISGIEQVTLLRLEYNKLTTLPENLFNYLIKLKYLYLHNNKIITLPSLTFLKQCINLKEIHLDGNYLDIKDPQFLALQKKYKSVLPSQRNPLELVKKRFGKQNIARTVLARQIGAKKWPWVNNQVPNKKKRRLELPINSKKRIKTE